MSASIGLDDPTVWNRTAVYNLGIPAAIGANGTGSNAYAGTMRPTSSATSASIRPGVCSSCRPRRMRSAVRTTRWAPAPSRTALSEISGHPETKWGGSVMAALQIKNIPTGAGDDIKFDVSYAKGTTKNVIATSGTSPSFAMFGGSGFGYQSVGFGATTDGVYLPGAGRHRRYRPDDGLGRPRRVQSQLGSVLVDAACSAATRPSGMTAAPTTICWVPEPPRPRALTALPSPPATRVRHWSATLRATTPVTPTSTSRSSASFTRWTPVKNLTFSGEVQWFHLDQKMSGSFGVHGDRSEAGRALRVQGSGHGPASGPRPA